MGLNNNFSTGMQRGCTISKEWRGALEPCAQFLGQKVEPFSVVGVLRGHPCSFTQTDMSSSVSKSDKLTGLPRWTWSVLSALVCRE